jgi:hypothetical protein
MVSEVAPVASGAGHQALAVKEVQGLPPNRTAAGGALLLAGCAGEAGEIAEEAEVTGGVLVLS